MSGSIVSVPSVPRRIFWPFAIALALPVALGAADEEVADPNQPINRLFAPIKLLDPAEEEAQAFQSWLNGGFRPRRLVQPQFNGVAAEVSVETANEVLDKVLFGPETLGSDDARERFDSRLKETIERINRICSLTEAQTHKLELAGRGDVHRFFRRVELLREQVPELLIEGVSLEFARETRDLHSLVRHGTFDKGSLFAKTLRKVMTAEQVAEYRQRRREFKPKIQAMLPDLSVER